MNSKLFFPSSNCKYREIITKYNVKLKRTNRWERKKEKETRIFLIRHIFLLLSYADITTWWGKYFQRIYLLKRSLIFIWDVTDFCVPFFIKVSSFPVIPLTDTPETNECRTRTQLRKTEENERKIMIIEILCMHKSPRIDGELKNSRNTIFRITENLMIEKEMWMNV